MCVALCFFPIVTAMLDAHCNCIPTDKERGGRSPRPLQGETARHSSPAVVTLPYDARCAAVCCPSWRTGPRLRPREMHAKNGHRISREFWELPPLAPAANGRAKAQLRCRWAMAPPIVPGFCCLCPRTSSQQHQQPQKFGLCAVGARGQQFVGPVTVERCCSVVVFVFRTFQ